MNQDVELLRELVSIASPSAQEQAASAYLAEACARRGYNEAFVDEVAPVGIWVRASGRLCCSGTLTPSRPYSRAPGG